MGGRTTIWMHETIPLRFEFLEPEAPSLHREWIEEILRSANTTGGIQLTPEHMETGPSDADLKRVPDSRAGGRGRLIAISARGGPCA